MRLMIAMINKVVVGERTVAESKHAGLPVARLCAALGDTDLRDRRVRGSGCPGARGRGLRADRPVGSRDALGAARPGPPQFNTPVTAAEVRGARFRVGLRGYRMQDVDALLALVADELDRRRSR